MYITVIQAEVMLIFDRLVVVHGLLPCHDLDRLLDLCLHGVGRLPCPYGGRLTALNNISDSTRMDRGDGWAVPTCSRPFPPHLPNRAAHRTVPLPRSRHHAPGYES